MIDILEFKEYVLQGKTIKELQDIYGISRTKVAEIKKLNGLVGLTPNSKRINRNEGIKVCTSCLETKSLNYFYSNGTSPTGLQKYKSKCITCENRERKSNLECKIIQYLHSCDKQYECEKCKYTGIFGSLDFHHVHPEDKSFSIGDYTNKTLSDTTFENDLIPELDKCILLCPNCHRQEHLLVGQK